MKHKPSKRNVERSEANVRKMETKYQMNAQQNPFRCTQYLRITNDELAPEAVAQTIMEYLK